MKKENNDFNTKKDSITPHAIPFCKKERSLCRLCASCEATFMYLPNGVESFHKCDCNV